MSKKTNPNENQRLPNLGKLSVAILEHINESFLGEKAVNELKAPLVQKALQDSLRKALEETEKRFRINSEDLDLEICEAIIDLRLADLPSVQDALQTFYNQPADPTLSQLLLKQLQIDSPKLPTQRIHEVVSAYIRILREELVSVSDDIREKLNTLASLDTEINTAQIVKLIKKLIDILTIDHGSSTQKPGNQSRSIANATNQGAQAGNINVNVGFPAQPASNANLIQNTVNDNDDDSRFTNIGWDARDLKLLRSYFRLGKKHRPALFKRELIDLDENKVRDHLISGGLAYLTNDGHMYLTRAGVILCCKQDRLPRNIFHTHVKFKDNSNVEVLTVELFGSVLYLYNELYRLLKPIFQRRLGSPSTRDDVGSEAVFFEYPEKAIVEALVNLLIHRDYLEDDMGRIIIYPDKIEFINPGQSEYPPEVLLEATASLHPKYSRNQRLIEAISNIGLNQRDGGGIVKIKEELKINGSYKPDGSLALSIENDERRNRFVLTIYKRIPRGINKLDGAYADHPFYVGMATQKFTPGSAPPVPSLVIGREDDLRNLKENLGVTGKVKASIQVLTAIKGWPGVGKTTTASALAHDPEIASQFPDGVLWTSLGQEPNILSEMATWGRALGSDEILKVRSVEEAQNLLTGLLRDKRMLLIIDDVWKVEDALPFKVGGLGCATLITTRLDGVANALAPSADNIYRLKVLKDDDALELLKQLAPSVVQQHPDECLVLVQELEGLPLALQVAGRLLNTEANAGFGVTELINELREGARLLGASAPSDRADLITETTPTIAALLQKSVDRLDDTTKGYYSYLGVFAPKPATFDMEAMKFVWQVEDPKPVIKTLVDRGLLEFVPELARYQMHVLLVMLAKTLLTDDVDSSVSNIEDEHLRHAQHYETVLRKAGDLYLQGGEALRRGLTLFDTEWENIRVGQAWAANHIDIVADAPWLCSAYADDGIYLLDLRLLPNEQILWLNAALAGSQHLNKRDAEGRHLNMLGTVNKNIGNIRKAIEYYVQALSILRDVGDRKSEANVLGNLGSAHQVLGNVLSSIKLFEEALSINLAIRDRRGEGTELNNLGMLYLYSGDPNRAVDAHKQALAIYREIGDLRGEANAMNGIAVTHRQLGDVNRAIEVHEQALKIFKQIGDHRGEGKTLSNLGIIYTMIGEFHKALDFYDWAYTILQELNDRFELGNIIWNQSLTLNKLGDFSRAVAFAERAFEIYEQIESPVALDVRKQLTEWSEQKNKE